MNFVENASQNFEHWELDPLNQLLAVYVSQVESYWDECLALPSKLKDWDAYNEMKAQIQQYLDVFPLLHKLASKVCYSLFTPVLKSVF